MNKAREVTRQFLYLRGAREFFVVFDRVEATKPEFARHFFLHVPTEPHAASNRLDWLSSPEADGDKSVLSHGRSRIFMTTLLPLDAKIVTRGGPGKDAWGHPLEPTAQYNHQNERGKKPPICPWRIEVADPSQGARTMFLHVFEITDENNQTPTAIKLVEPAGVQIGDKGQVRFNASGPLAGSVGDRALATEMHTESQYQ